MAQNERQIDREKYSTYFVSLLCHYLNVVAAADAAAADDVNVALDDDNVIVAWAVAIEFPTNAVDVVAL